MSIVLIVLIVTSATSTEVINWWCDNLKESGDSERRVFSENHKHKINNNIIETIVINGVKFNDFGTNNYSEGISWRLKSYSCSNLHVRIGWKQTCFDNNFVSTYRTFAKFYKIVYHCVKYIK